MYIIWGLPYSVGLKYLDSHRNRCNPEVDKPSGENTLDIAKNIHNILEETGFNKIKESSHGKQGRTKS